MHLSMLALPYGSTSRSPRWGSTGSRILVVPRWRARCTSAPQASTYLPFTGSYMEEVVQYLGDIITLHVKDLPTNQRLIVGLAGAPGSGKSTLSRHLCQHLNGDCSSRATVVGMDGYHLTRAQLDAMPNAKEAHARRGAPWTFDGAAFVLALASLRQADQESVHLPSFDHAVGDPVADDIVVSPHNRIVLAEGNYLLLDEPPWVALRENRVLDLAIFLSCDLDIAMNRVLERQVANGASRSVAKHRIDTNDRPNAELVITSGHRNADVEVPSSLPWRSSIDDGL